MKESSKRATPADLGVIHEGGAVCAPSLGMLRTFRVLVADDDAEMLAAVADTFRRLGAEVVEAESGAELIIRLANGRPFSLVVADISMPWMDGLKALQSARAAGHGMGVIVMTGLRDPRIEEQVAALGPDVILLRKPFPLTALERAATSLLSRDQPPAQVG